MSLDAAREELDRLDAEIVRLLDQRALMGRKIGEIKRARNLSLHHPEREMEVLRRVDRLSDGSFPPQGLERVYRVIMAETLAMQTVSDGETACACGGAAPDGKKDVHAVVVENVRIAPGFNRMRLLAPELAGVFSPGQFFQMRIGRAESAFFLRRPFAPSEYHRDGFSFYYAVVGSGTGRLDDFGPGTDVDVLAPLGNGFSPLSRGGTAVLFGGGCGAPSLATLAARLRMGGDRVVTILGARSAGALLNREGFAEAGRVVTSTDDGSHGFRGTVVDAFNAEVGGGLRGEVRFYACGPLGMLRAVAGLAAGLGVECEVSLEERMACGFGACMGCAVPVRDGVGGSVYRRVCHEGPVFDARDLMWDEM